MLLYISRYNPAPIFRRRLCDTVFFSPFHFPFREVTRETVARLFAKRATRLPSPSPSAGIVERRGGHGRIRFCGRKRIARCTLTLATSASGREERAVSGARTISALRASRHIDSQWERGCRGRRSARKSGSRVPFPATDREQRERETFIKGGVAASLIRPKFSRENKWFLFARISLSARHYKINITY